MGRQLLPRKLLGEEEKEMTFTDKDMALILSALEGDTIGKWGDDRAERIARLIKKIKREGKR